MPTLPLSTRFRAPNDLGGTFGIPGRAAPIPAFNSVRVRQAGVAGGGGGAGLYAMSSAPLVGSLIFLFNGREESLWTSVTALGAGVTTWNQLAAGKFTTSAGSVSGAAVWGIVDSPTPSAWYQGVLNGTIAQSSSYMEITGLQGTILHAQTINSTNSNPATATFAGMRASVPGGILVIATISQNGPGTITGITMTTAATAAAGNRVGLIAYSPSPIPCNAVAVTPTITATGSNSRIVGAMMLVK